MFLGSTYMTQTTHNVHDLVLGKLFTPIVYQAAKLVASLLRVTRVTAGLSESNGSLPPGL